MYEVTRNQTIATPEKGWKPARFYGILDPEFVPYMFIREIEEDPEVTTLKDLAKKHGFLISKM